MGDVFSIRTKKQLDNQDTKANDELAGKGVYIGCLPKLDADVVRNIQTMMSTKRAQIDELIGEFDADYLTYLSIVCDLLVFFKQSTENFNPGEDELMIGEDGHCWVVKIKGDEL